ncbi:MAG: M48 family metalloprotease [Sphingomonadales bacterium]|jgi:predicted Zn-dependent protease
MTRMIRTLVASVSLAMAAPVLAQSAPGLSPSERQSGAQAHADIVQQFGGAVSGPAADYVRRVGQRIAVQSGGGARPEDYTVTLLNSNVNNAFAVPGGYVYITRQLLALMNNEAQLAFVMGHEVGHVAARHSQKRQTRALGSNILAGLAGILTGSDLVGRIANAGAGLYTLGYSRDQEREADSLGVRYLAGAGYDPLAATGALAALGAQTALEGRLSGQGGTEPSKWLSTHPPTTERVDRTRQEAQALLARAGARATNRDAFLNAIDGLIYDDDPSQGVVQGRSFRHPGLGLAFDAPQGFSLTNGSDAVTGSAPGNLRFELRAADARTADLNSIAADRWRAIGANPADMRATRINGIEALSGTVRANGQNGPVDAALTVYRWTPQLALTLVTLAPAGQLAGVSPVADSLRRMTVQDSATVRARRIQVVRVTATDTLASLAARMAYDDDRMARFLTLNQLDASARLKVADRVKLVVMR